MWTNKINSGTFGCPYDGMRQLWVGLIGLSWAGHLPVSQLGSTSEARAAEETQVQSIPFLTRSAAARSDGP